MDFSIADPNPVLVVSSGELGALASLAEHNREFGEMTIGKNDKDFDHADVDEFLIEIKEFDKNRDRHRVAKMTVYFPVSDFVPGKEAELRYFFEQIIMLSDEKIISWASQRQVYLTYLDWTK